MAVRRRFVCERTQYSDEIPDNVVHMLDTIKEILCQVAPPLVPQEMWPTWGHAITGSMDRIAFADGSGLYLKQGDFAPWSSVRFPYLWGSVTEVAVVMELDDSALRWYPTPADQTRLRNALIQLLRARFGGRPRLDVLINMTRGDTPSYLAHVMVTVSL